jgi:hypothetical protein
MSVTIHDAAAVAVLASTTGVDVEVRGPDGLLLGRFTPAPRPGRMFPEFGVTDEEMDRRLNDPDGKWVTGEEVMARLRSLRDAH